MKNVKGSFEKNVRSERGEGDTLKAYKNLQGEGGGRGKAYVRHEKIASSVGGFSPHISTIKQLLASKHYQWMSNVRWSSAKQDRYYNKGLRF